MPRDIPQEPAQTKETARGGRGGVAAAGGRGRLPRHLRRPSGLLSAAHHVEDPVRRAERADSARAGLQQAPRADGVRQRQHHRAPEPLLRGRHRAAGADARGGREGAHRRVREAEARAGHRHRAAAGQEPVRARLHRRPRVEPGQGAAPGARGRHPQRHHDGRRRVRHLHQRHDRRRAARGADLLQRDQPHGAATSCRKAGGSR